MDSLALKNKLVDFLTFESRSNLNLENKSLKRFSGSFLDLIHFKKSLYRNANSIIEQLRRSGVNVDISPHADADADRKGIDIRFALTSPTAQETKVKLINKLLFSYKEHFFITHPQAEADAYILKDTLERMKGLHYGSLDGGKVLITVPRIYFDYLEGRMMIQFTIRQVIRKAEVIKEEYHFSTKGWAAVFERQSNKTTVHNPNPMYKGFVEIDDDPKDMEETIEKLELEGKTLDEATEIVKEKYAWLEPPTDLPEVKSFNEELEETELSKSSAM